jgi:hypothetical protein
MSIYSLISTCISERMLKPLSVYMYTVFLFILSCKGTRRFWLACKLFAKQGQDVTKLWFAITIDMVHLCLDQFRPVELCLYGKE